jgi:hypothetical protein
MKIHATDWAGQPESPATVQADIEGFAGKNYIVLQSPSHERHRRRTLVRTRKPSAVRIKEMKLSNQLIVSCIHYKNIHG